MDSINKNQPEENRRDLRGQEAVGRIREVVEQAQHCFFCTAAGVGESAGSRPMNVREVDEDGNLWFLSASDSRKNAEIEENPSVELYFHGSAHSDFLHLRGRATISSDRARIKALWSPILSTWFTKGIDDPRITVIEFSPLDGYYWDNKHGQAIAAIKMLIGAAIGRTLDDSIEGRIDV